MKALTLIVTLLLASHLFAQDRRGDLLRQTRSLSDLIINESYTSQASIDDINQADMLLAQGLRLLRSIGDRPTDPQLYKQCINYAYPKFRRDLDDSTSLERAQSVCRRVADMLVVDFLYDKHYRDLSASQAIQRAAEESTISVKDKLDLIKWAYKKHYRDLNSTSAASKAVRNARLIRSSRSGVICFEEYFKIHYRNNSSTVAMDKTAETCSRLEK